MRYASRSTMAFRFWRRIKLAPGVTVNLSKSGGSLSFGPRGGHLTIGPHGTRVTAGIPGTGLFYTQRVRSSRARRPRARRAATRQAAPHTATLPPAPVIPPERRLTMGFFKRLFTPKEEEALVDGMREYVLGDQDQALEHLRQASHLADGAFLAGMIAMKQGHAEEAAGHLEAADRLHEGLGRYFNRYGINVTVGLSITPELAAHLHPSLRGTLLMLVKVYEHMDRPDRARECLERLRKLVPDDAVVLLSLVEVMWDEECAGASKDAGARKAGAERIVRLAAKIENDTAVHATILLYKARALSALGLHAAARDTLTAALRRTKDRPEELLHALRYERALVYGAMGNARRSREELEQLYAEDPDYEDVRARLGLAPRSGT